MKSDKVRLNAETIEKLKALIESKTFLKTYDSAVAFLLDFYDHQKGSEKPN